MKDDLWDSLHEEQGATLKHNIWDSLHEEQGATLKHKCGKRDSSIALFFFFLFLGLSFIFFLAFLFFGQCSNNDDHHTSIDYNIRITTRNLEQDMTIWMPPAVYRDSAMNQEWHVWKIMHGGFATNTMSTTWSCNGNMTKVKYVIMMNGTVESCMAIYLGMAMEMP